MNDIKLSVSLQFVEQISYGFQEILEYSGHNINLNHLSLKYHIFFKNLNCWDICFRSEFCFWLHVQAQNLLSIYFSIYANLHTFYTRTLVEVLLWMSLRNVIDMLWNLAIVCRHISCFHRCVQILLTQKQF